MDQGLIPNRYAKALYKFALEKGSAERVYELMKCLCASFVEQPRLQEVVANPFVATGDKTALLTTAAHAAGDDTVFADFLKLLVENRRIDMVRPIALRAMILWKKISARQSAAPTIPIRRKKRSAPPDQARVKSPTARTARPAIPMILLYF